MGPAVGNFTRPHSAVAVRCGTVERAVEGGQSKRAQDTEWWAGNKVARCSSRTTENVNSVTSTDV